MFRVSFQKEWIVPTTIKGVVCDKDGCLLNSELKIRGQIIDTAKYFAGVDDFSADQIGAINACFGQPDDQMSLALWQVLQAECFTGPIRQVPRDQFVRVFAEARAQGWYEKSLSGILTPMPGALAFLEHVRNRKLFSGLYTSMPSQMVAKTVTHVLKADDLFAGECRVCCDDSRLHGLGKPHPRGWQVIAEVAHKQGQLAPHELVAVEDRATGAVGALQADYGFVVVVPDPDDVSVDLWDRKELIERHLATNPTDMGKLVFLESLTHLRFD